jgi:hypothetical protein
MLLWANLHGGFVAGLGTIAIYSCVTACQAYLLHERQHSKSQPVASVGERLKCLTTASTLQTLSLVGLASLLVTCVNPYGPRFWCYLLPAVLAKRPLIAEWQPLPVFGSDTFTPFRLLFLLVTLLLIIGWTKVQKRSWTGVVMLLVTSALAWRSRRHAPFFGVAALAFAGPYLDATISRMRDWAAGRPFKWVGTRSRDGNSSIGMVLVYGALAMYAATNWLPDASLQVLAPVGDVPVREADILSLAQAKGNLATPFHWGSYTTWRLYPNIKISMDGRYEAAYPEATFQLNGRFFDKNGQDWDRLIREYPVDYVLLDLSQPGLRPEDLRDRGYVLIWVTKDSSALLALEKHADRLRAVAAALPPTTIEPLDPAVTDRWWAP